MFGRRHVGPQVALKAYADCGLPMVRWGTVCGQQGLGQLPMPSWLSLPSFTCSNLRAFLECMVGGMGSRAVRLRDMWGGNSVDVCSQAHWVDAAWCGYPLRGGAVGRGQSGRRRLLTSGVGQPTSAKREIRQWPCIR